MSIKGFIDLHTHGIGKYDTKTSLPEVILKIAELHGKEGVSIIIPTIYPAPIANMRENMEAVKRAMQIQDSTKGSSKQQSLILGLHLEGPFLNPLMSGALDMRSFQKPTIDTLKRLIEGFEDILKIITIAPEIPGALRVIEKCREFGIKVNMGHSNATYKEALNGKKAGATGVTHIFNAMRPFHHRDPGIAGFALMDEELFIEVIADGVHLSKEVLKLIFSVKDSKRIIVVSDLVKAAGLKKYPMYKKGVLKGSKMALSGTVKVLEQIDLPRSVIQKALIENPARYLEPDEKVKTPL